MSRPRRSGVGPRGELLVLMPAALLVLIVLSSYALFAYRSSIVLLIEERQNAARFLGRQLSSKFEDEGLPKEGRRWKQALPRGAVVTVYDAAGRYRFGDGLLDRQAFGTVSGRQNLVGDFVSASDDFQYRGQQYTVWVDLPAPILMSRARGLSLLTPIVISINASITLLVMIFLRRFLAPLDRMLARARDAGQGEPGSQDEVAFLVETFEKALEAMAHPPEVDELEAIQGTLVRSLKSGVLLCDEHGVVLGLNEVGLELLGLRTVPLGLPAQGALAGQPEFAETLGRAMREGETVERQEVAIEGSRGRRLVGITVHPLRRDDMGIRGFLVIFADLTEAQAREEEKRLLDSLSQLGEMTAGVAHELRNSLATLRGYLSLVERRRQQGGDSAEALDDYLAEIRYESDHLQRVLEDFLSFARPGSIRPQEVDVSKLVRRAAADPALDGAAVRLDVDDSNLGAEGGAFRPVVQGDPQLLERAVRNILHNAVEAQRQTGCDDAVEVRLAIRDAGVEMTVKDRGPGFSEDMRGRVFDPFFSARPGGVGMGLALTRRIVLLHAGRIALEPRSGGGIQAILWIPFGTIDTEGNNS